jgi:hypothetical protein
MGWVISCHLQGQVISHIIDEKGKRGEGIKDGLVLHLLKAQQNNWYR